MFKKNFLNFFSFFLNFFYFHLLLKKKKIKLINFFYVKYQIFLYYLFCNFKWLFKFNFFLVKKNKKIANILIKRTKSNYFITLIDDYSKKTFFKISGGFAYKIGILSNKKQANTKKLKYKTTVTYKKRRKDFKKTSYFALEYILSLVFLNVLKNDYTHVNFYIYGFFKSYLYNTLFRYWRDNFIHFIILNSIQFNPKLSHNGMRTKKIRRL